MIAIIQVNLGGGSGAQNLVLQTAAEKQIDILILSEYYKYGKTHNDWYCDQSNRSAIAPISDIAIDEIGGSIDNGFVWVTVAGLRLYSCYWSPNTAFAEFEDFLRKLETSIRSSPVPAIIAGDLNAKHSSWGSPVDDRKGKALADLVQALDLEVCNTGSTPTREKDGSQSYIDVTLVYEPGATIIMPLNPELKNI